MPPGPPDHPGLGQTPRMGWLRVPAPHLPFSSVFRAELSLTPWGPTVENRGWVVEEGVVGAKEQVGTVAPGAQIEEELPGALGHLGGISGLEAAPLGQGLWGRRRVAIRAGAIPLGGGGRGPGIPRAGQSWGGATGCPQPPGVTRAHVCLPRAKLSAQLSG